MGKNLSHQTRSFLTMSGISCKNSEELYIDLSHINNLEIKILLGFTHAATKFSFPSKDCNVVMKPYLCLTKI